MIRDIEGEKNMFVMHYTLSWQSTRFLNICCSGLEIDSPYFIKFEALGHESLTNKKGNQIHILMTIPGGL